MENQQNLQNFANNGGDLGANKETNVADIEMQSKIDKAVTKVLQTQKANLEREYNETLQGYQNQLKAFEEKGLTDAEKAAKQLKAAADAEKSYKEMKQRLELEVNFSKMGVAEEDYKSIIDSYLKNDFISANSKIAEVIEKRANEIAAQKYNANVQNLPNPNQGNSNDGEMTKAKFDKLTYSQQMELLDKHPEFTKFLK